MKKVLASLLVLFVLMIGVPLSAEAHNSCPRHRRAKRSTVSRTYRAAPRYYAARGYAYKRPSFYQRHRKWINLAIATGGGAAIGGIAKGKKGALIGGIGGAGAGALFNILQKRRSY